MSLIPSPLLYMGLLNLPSSPLLYRGLSSLLISGDRKDLLAQLDLALGSNSTLVAQLDGLLPSENIQLYIQLYIQPYIMHLMCHQMHLSSHCLPMVDSLFHQ